MPVIQKKSLAFDMKLIFFLFLVSSVFSSSDLCTKGGLKRIHQPTPGRSFANGNPILPGQNTAGLGYDITTGDVMDLPVLHYTYDAGYTWSFPEYPDVVYAVPDQVYATTYPETDLVNQTYVYHDVEDIVDFQIKWSHSSSWFGLFSKSKETIDFSEQYYEQDDASSTNYLWVSFYKIDQSKWSGIQVDSIFQQIVGMLPRTYDASTKSSYFSFFSRYGTDYITTLHMGGTMQANVEFHKCFSSSYSAEWVFEMSSFSLLGLINIGSEKDKYEKKVDENFKKYSKTYLCYVGGDQSLNATDWQQWMGTIHNAYMPTQIETQPLTDLVTDPVIKANLVQARKDYLMKAQETFNATLTTLAANDPHTTLPCCNSTLPHDKKTNEIPREGDMEFAQQIMGVNQVGATEPKKILHVLPTEHAEKAKKFMGIA